MKRFLIVLLLALICVLGFADPPSAKSGAIGQFVLETAPNFFEMPDIIGSVGFEAGLQLDGLFLIGGVYNYVSKEPTGEWFPNVKVGAAAGFHYDLFALEYTFLSRFIKGSNVPRGEDIHIITMRIGGLLEAKPRCK